jgi:hypothetical protein
MPEIDGASGRLYLDENGRVHRRLAWAQFRRGEPQALPAVGNKAEFSRPQDEAGDTDPDEDVTWDEGTDDF